MRLFGVPLVRQQEVIVGMFDSVFARCPNCGSAVEFQSKAGDCVLGRYSVTDVPPKIVADIDGQKETCYDCGYVVTARLVQNPHVVFE